MQENQKKSTTNVGGGTRQRRTIWWEFKKKKQNYIEGNDRQLTEEHGPEKERVLGRRLSIPLSMEW